LRGSRQFHEAFLQGNPEWLRILSRTLALLAAGLIAAGCATTPVDTARHQFYAGRFQEAAATLETGEPGPDRVLVLMERGTALQAAGRYEESARDYIAAADIIGDLETYSISKGAASLVINDMLQDFRGAPYERTLLHTMTALDHLALGAWENAAVEARRIIQSLDPDLIGEFPQDAFSRYVAGFCLEMVDDLSNARLQYRLASQSSLGARVDEKTGRLLPASSTNRATAAAGGRDRCELVFFALLGRSPRAAEVVDGRVSRPAPPYVELYSDGRRLGRSYLLGDVGWLAVETEQKLALYRAGKTVARVIAKEAIARSVERNTRSEAMGDLTRLVLIGLLERPDLRRWETLPRWLEVARVSAPCDLRRLVVKVRSAAGAVLFTREMDQPLQRRRHLWVSFFRYPPPAPRPHASPSPSRTAASSAAPTSP